MSINDPVTTPQTPHTGCNRLREMSMYQQQQLQLVRLIVQKMEIHTEDFAEYSEWDWDREADMECVPATPISSPTGCRS